MSISPQGAAAAPANEERLYQETMQALDTPEKEASVLRKAGLLIGTLALSVLAFLWLDATLLTLVLIVLVVLFHELGHYVGMRLFGYRDVRMFFIPFFGAAVSGIKYGVPVWQHAIVLLLGPLPGLALAVALHWLYEPLPGTELDALVWMLTFLNALNLLPVMPLDGGRLVNALFFARQPYLAAGFQLLAGCTLAAYAWLTSSWVLGLIGVFLLLGVTSTYQDARWGEALRAEKLELPDEIERLNAEQRRRLFARAVQGVPQDQRVPARLAANLRAVYEHMMVRRPSLLTTALFMALYLAGFAAAVGDEGGGPLTLARAADDRALLASLRDKRDEAMAEYRRALAIREAYVARYPAQVEGQFALSLSYDHLSLESHAIGARAQRLDHLEKVLAIRKKLVEQEPSVARWQYELSRAHKAMAAYHGDSYAGGARPAEALAHVNKAITLQEAAIAEDWRSRLGYRWSYDSGAGRSNLSELHREAGQLLVRLGRPREAVKHYLLSLSIEESLARPYWLAPLHDRLGEALAAAGDRVEAVEHFRKAIELYQKEIAGGTRFVATTKWHLDRAIHSLAPLLHELGRESEALDLYRAALADREKSASETERKESSGKDGRPGPDTARALENVSRQALLARDFSKALSAAERSLALAPGRRRAEANRAHALLLLGRTEAAHTVYLARKGQPAEDGQTWEQMLAADLATLRRAGVSHPSMVEIEKLLGISEQR